MINNSNKKNFNELVNIMEILRSKEGCPWDREQTHKSLKPYLIEECYEVLEAIDENDDRKMCEELGDLLLQIVFHAELAKEKGSFDIIDVCDGICNKMIERHPHVFSDNTVKNSNEVLDNWDIIKRKEQNINTYTDELKHIPKNLPALMRANKVQKKAAKVGFDFNNIEDVRNKILEELNEVNEVYKCENKAKIEEEIGDLIFSCINYARHLDIEPEIALNCTIDKFISRFEFIEKASQSENKDLKCMELQEMDKLWENSKDKY